MKNEVFLDTSYAIAFFHRYFSPSSGGIGRVVTVNGYADCHDLTGDIRNW